LVSTLSSSDRIRAALDHRQADRIPMIETDFWPATLERWYAEGLPEGVDPVDAFQLDRIEHFFGIFDCTLQAEVKVLEEGDDYVVRTSPYGTVFKEFKVPSHPPLLLEPGIRDRSDWEKVRGRLVADPSRLRLGDAVERSCRLRQEGTFVTVETIEPLWFVLYNTMGFEHGLMMMATDPDLVEEMIATYATFSVDMLEICFRQGFRADALFLYSDLCYRSGMLFSPRSFRALATPHLARFADFCQRHGMYFLWHSDGNVAQLIPLLLELGVDGIHPLEARAGNDVRLYKERHGEAITLIGNINADVVARGDREEIEREVAAKIPVAKAGGGYIYHIDHSVPPTVSLESYRFLLERVRNYGGYED